MEQSKLNIILKEHARWLKDNSKGKRANLSDANLTDANLKGANLRNALGNSKEIKTLQTEFYTVVYTSTQMAIGCEQHAITDWFKFDDKRIKAMDKRATNFWTIYKPILITLTNINKSKRTNWRIKLYIRYLHGFNF